MKTFKTAFLISILHFTFNSFSQTTNEIEIDEIDDNEFIDHYSISDASFPGGVDSLVQFLKENMKYLDTCISLSANGRVYIKFFVELDGSITNISTMKNNTGCDQISIECIRVLSSMPKWIPAEENGIKKRVAYRIPINLKYE